jgi:hypothetical protein
MWRNKEGGKSKEGLRAQKGNVRCCDTLAGGTYISSVLSGGGSSEFLKLIPG